MLVPRLVERFTPFICPAKGRLATRERRSSFFRNAASSMEPAGGIVRLLTAQRSLAMAGSGSVCGRLFRQQPCNGCIESRGIDFAVDHFAHLAVTVDQIGARQAAAVPASIERFGPGGDV